MRMNTFQNSLQFVLVDLKKKKIKEENKTDVGGNFRAH